MRPDAMSVRLHLRRVRVIVVVVDLVERLVVEIADVRRVVRCPHCGFKTTRVHDDRRLRVHDLPTRGRPTELVWVRRRFVCGECSERHWEDHPEIIVGWPANWSGTSTSCRSGRWPAATNSPGIS